MFRFLTMHHHRRKTDSKTTVEDLAGRVDTLEKVFQVKLEQIDKRFDSLENNDREILNNFKEFRSPKFGLWISTSTLLLAIVVTLSNGYIAMPMGEIKLRQKENIVYQRELNEKSMERLALLEKEQAKNDARQDLLFNDVFSHLQRHRSELDKLSDDFNSIDKKRVALKERVFNLERRVFSA